MRQSLTRFLTPVVVAAAVTGGVATAAHASAPAPSPPTSSVTAKAGPRTLPAVVPSWWWGATTVCIRNVGSKPGTAYISPYFFIDVQPGQEECEAYWFWGAPIVALNVSTSHTELVGRTY